MPGKTLIKVSSVIFIIGAILSLIVYPIGAGLLAWATVHIGENLGWVLVAICVLYTIASVLQLMAGVKGMKFANDKSQAASLVHWGIIVLVISVLSSGFTMFHAIMNGTDTWWYNLIALLCGLLFPVLYILGAKKNENA